MANPRVPTHNTDPDEATEAIVDFAIQHNKPFALLPCCVFHRRFNHRRLEGEEVTQRHQLVEYLRLKAPGAEVVHLPFEGANQCVFRR